MSAANPIRYLLLPAHEVRIFLHEGQLLGLPTSDFGNEFEVELTPTTWAQYERKGTLLIYDSTHAGLLFGEDWIDGEFTPALPTDGEPVDGEPVDDEETWDSEEEDASDDSSST